MMHSPNTLNERVHERLVLSMIKMHFHLVHLYTSTGISVIPTEHYKNKLDGR